MVKKFHQEAVDGDLLIGALVVAMGFFYHARVCVCDPVTELD